MAWPVAPSSYSFSPSGTAQQPWVVFAPTGANTAPFAITVFVDDIFTTGPSAPIVSGPFTLGPTQPSDQRPGLPWKVTLAADGAAWRFDTAPIRAQLYADFLAFCVAVENADGSAGAQVLKPGRLRAFQSYLAQSLPQTFAETLLYRYGFDPVSRCIDLLPGTRLRIGFQAHQALDPERNPLNGFVGSGQVDLDVGVSHGSTNLSLGSFVSLLQGLSVAPNTGGAGGELDLQGQAFAYPYFRLIYPADLAGSDGVGFTGIAGNAALLGAPTFAGLVAATDSYVRTGTVGSGAVSAFFRGRATVTPLIPVFLQGIREFVAVGTTVRDLLAGLATVPWFDTGTVSVPSQFYVRQRTDLQGTKAPPVWSFQPAQAGTSPPVIFSTQVGGYGTYGPAFDSFDLPVLGGDSVSLPLPAS